MQFCILLPFKSDFEWPFGKLLSAEGSVGWRIEVARGCLPCVAGVPRCLAAVQHGHL